ncbi:MAG: hypothetical protein HPY50_20135 [Firmicutes bacterium]|nr:hypothetical protein [Bacillota bacterium]
MLLAEAVFVAVDVAEPERPGLQKVGGDGDDLSQVLETERLPDFESPRPDFMSLGFFYHGRSFSFLLGINKKTLES